MQNKFAAIIAALMILVMSGAAMGAPYDSNVTLEDKTGNPNWNTIPNGISATIDYNAKGAEFEWHAYGTAPLNGTEYVLIYYADKPDRHNNYGGDNPGALIGTMTTGSDGSFDSGDCSIDLGFDLPHPNDYNAEPDPWDEYCNDSGPDGYDNCWGAKLWMVPADDYVNGVVVNWNVGDYLFETNLVQYCRSCYTPHAVPDTATFSIGDAFGVDTVPIVITNATNAGSVDMTLTYDASVVKVTGVTGGDMTATFDNVGVGQVRIGAYHSAAQGLSGEFTLAYVSFEPVTNGSCDFGITVKTYKDATPCGRAMPNDNVTGVYCSYLNGDVNGDGDVCMGDVMYLAKHVLGITGFEDIVECASDVDQSVGIDINDVAYLARHIIGITGFDELN